MEKDHGRILTASSYMLVVSSLANPWSLALASPKSKGLASIDIQPHWPMDNSWEKYLGWLKKKYLGYILQATPRGAATSASLVSFVSLD